MKYCITDCRCTRNCRRFTQCFVSERSNRIIKFHKICLDIRSIHHCHQFIVQQGSVQWSSCFLIQNELLRQTVSNSHRHTALYLHFSQFRINKLPAIMHINDMKDFDLAKLYIDFHFSKAASCGNRIFLYLLGNLCCNNRRIAKTVITFQCKISKRYCRILSCHDPPMIKPQFPCLFRQQLFCIIQNLFLQKICAVFNNCSCYKRLSGCIGTGIKWCYISILDRLDMNITDIHI